MLADLGADVDQGRAARRRFDAADAGRGGQRQPGFNAVNRGKRSIVLEPENGRRAATSFARLARID